MISTYQKCFISGILACIGSVFAKWAFGDISLDDIYDFKIVAIRLISLICMVYFNTKGLTLFIENLKVRFLKIWRKIWVRVPSHSTPYFYIHLVDHYRYNPRLESSFSIGLSNKNPYDT